MKFQIPNSKFQINPKSQIPNSRHVWNFGHWRLELIWNLLLGNCNFRSRGSANGFTLIETIVALAVLLMALAGPVTLVTQSFFSVASAKNKLIAAFLAEEGIEAIRAIRENNKICQSLGNLGWDWGSSGTSPPLLRNGSAWRVDMLIINTVTCSGVNLEYPKLMIPCDLSNPGHRLKIDSMGRYGYSGEDTIFTRCVNVTQPISDEILPSGNTIPKQDILDVVSTIQWQEHGKTKTFELRERLYNWE